MAAGCYRRVTHHDVYVVPVCELFYDFSMRIGVCPTKVLERLVRENDTPSEGVSARISFQHGYLMRRIRLLE